MARDTTRLQVFVMPQVHTRLALRARSGLLCAGENVSRLCPAHHLRHAGYSNALDGQLALVSPLVQSNQLAPVHVRLLDDLQGKICVLELAVKCKLILRFSVRNLVDPAGERIIFRGLRDLPPT